MASTDPPPVPGGWREELSFSTDAAYCAADPTGDGDQSVVNSMTEAAIYLRHAWRNSADLYQLLCKDPGPAPTPGLFFRYCFTGNSVMVAAMLQEAAQADAALSEAGGEGSEKTGHVPGRREDAERRGGRIHALLETRFSGLREAPIHAVVSGAKNIGFHHAMRQEVPRVTEGGPCDQWGKCLSLLLKAGARVEAKDVAGYTALALATNGVAFHEVVLELALQLGDEGGADPNAVIRVDETPIVCEAMASISGGRLLCCTVLYELGATPNSFRPRALNEMSAGKLLRGMRSLEPLLPQMALEAASRMAQTGTQALRGKLVSVVGLQKHAELNGKVGK